MSNQDQPSMQKPQFQVYHPNTPRPQGPQQPVVRLQKVELLSTQEEFAENLTSGILAQLIRTIEESLQKTLAQSSTSFRIRLQITLHPEKDIVLDLCVDKDIDQDVVDVIFDNFSKLESREIRTNQKTIDLYAYFIVQPTVQ